MTDDPKFEGFLQRESAAYNAPPSEVPRDEMFAAIQATRAARRTNPSARPVAVAPRPRYATWIGMAATLLVGVGIGRFALQGGAGPVATSAADAPATLAPTTVAAVTDDREGDEPSDRASTADTASTADAPLTRQIARVVPPRPVGGSEAPGALSTPSPYSVASQAHLARAEALIAVIATQSRDAVVDSVTATWARDVLSNTRLLLDSPAGDDPVRRRLFEDVETLLVQLIQRSGSAADERALFDRTLQKTQILTRLRTGAAGT